MYEDYRLSRANSRAFPVRFLLTCPGMLSWIHDRALTLALMAMFVVFLAGQYVAGFKEYNESRKEHGQPQIAMAGYFSTGHWWEGVFENWESEFLQMAVFVLLTSWSTRTPATSRIDRVCRGRCAAADGCSASPKIRSASHSSRCS